MLISDLQKQIAGDNSTQMQASGDIIINNSGGITTETAIEIYKSLFERDKALCVSEAVSKATERVNSLLDKLMDEILKLKEQEKILEAFEEPAFQALLMNAQKSAACSENEISLDNLTELIIARVRKGDNIQNRIGINHAVEIIDQIDAVSLSALTVLYAVENFVSKKVDPIEGIKHIDNLYSILMEQELPPFDDNSWLDGLDILKVIRINQSTNFKSFSDFYSLTLDGYSCAGIAKGSKEYEEAIKILEGENLFPYMLSDNVFMPGYVRLNVVGHGYLNRIPAVDTQGQFQSYIALPDKEKAIREVWNLYTKDPPAIKKAKIAFMSEVDSHPTIKKIHEWWDSFPYYFTITLAGSAIAYANAKRIAPDLPELPF